MEETFRAIGFEVPDEVAYNDLAEVAGARGSRTRISRRGATLHGCCWKVGDGIEVWAVLYESAAGEYYYADCRPAYRPRHAQPVESWELVEYDEDGEAVVEGTLTRNTAPITFELQNLTELEEETFTQPRLSVALGGLAYDVRVAPKGATLGITPAAGEGSVPPPDGSDYAVTGRVIQSASLRNPITEADLVWMLLDVGGAPLEIVVRRAALEGDAAPGTKVEAEVWLQGYVLDERTERARYEGVDPEWEPAESWSLLRRSN
jgi:hypothetical protein